MGPMLASYSHTEAGRKFLENLVAGEGVFAPLARSDI